MREVIWYEDDFFLVGGERIDMDPEVVTLPEEPMPLAFNYNHGGSALGWVKHLRLDGGEITGEIEIFNQFKELYERNLKKSCRLGGYYLGVKLNERRDQVLAATLRSVSVILNPANPVFPIP